MKISYADSKSADVAIAKTLRDEIHRRDDRIAALKTKYNEMRRRTYQFIAEVDSIRFRVDEAQAEPWMEQWGAFLLSGRRPAKPDAEE